MRHSAREGVEQLSDGGLDEQDRVAFLVTTDPGRKPGMLAKVASGGELSRLMLALKVVLARGSPVPTLVFDEVESGIDGATAAAVGERLAPVAERLETRVTPLEPGARREEIARMLAGEQVTEAARGGGRAADRGGLTGRPGEAMARPVEKCPSDAKAISGGPLTRWRHPRPDL